jgi:ATP-binding cassette subfamily C protein CydD/ATP-binding cassette subfamily C protein CydCD
MGALDRRLWRHARSTRGFLVVTVLLGLATAALVIAQAGLLATGIAAVTAGSDLPRGLLVGLALVVAARAAVAWAQESAAHRTAASVQAELRDGVFRAVARRGYLDGEHAGALTHLATRGLDGLDAYFARYLPQVVLAALVPLTMLAVIFPVDPVAATTMLVTVPLIPVFLALVGWTTRERHRRHYEVLETVSRHVLELVRGLPTLVTLGRAGAQVANVRRLGEAQHRITMRTLRLAFVSSLVLELLATLSVALVAVAVGLRLVGGGLDLRTALFVLILAPEVYLPLRQLGAQHHAAADGVAAATGAFAWLDAAAPPAGTGRPSVGPIRLDQVTVHYPDRAAPALTGCELRLDPGEVVALTGPSGCGKSTVLRLLLGFVTPAHGRVEVAGVDLREVDLTWWRTQVAWVPQRAHLFPGTVAQNIALGAGHDDRVAGAARAAGIEHRLTTTVESGLSTGERQRVALARAFLRDAPVLLLDEPTANLDGAAEAALVDSIRTLCRGRTVLLVAHRPALLTLADRVVDLTRTTEEVPA